MIYILLFLSIFLANSISATVTAPEAILVNQGNLTSKIKFQPNNRRPTNVKVMSQENENSFPYFPTYLRTATKNDKLLVRQPIRTSDPENEHFYTLPEYLDQIFEYYGAQGQYVPAKIIAHLVLRMRNALHSYEIGEIPGKNLKFDTALTLDDFLAKPEGKKEWKPKIRFDGSKMQKSFHFKNLKIMSPQQLQSEHPKTDKTDLVWLIGVVIHLILYREFPLDGWAPKQELDTKYNLAGMARRRISMLEMSEYRERMANFEQNYRSELRVLVRKRLMESGGQIPIREFGAFANSMDYKCLLSMMKDCLEINDEKRISLDQLGNRLVQLVNGYGYGL